MNDSGDRRASLLPGCVPECPGCAHKYLTPEQSMTQKQEWLKKRLSAWADQFAPIQGVDADTRWAYREKVCLSTRWDTGKWRFGLIKNETVIPIHDCPIHSSRIREAISLLAPTLPDPESFPMVYFVQSGSQVTLVVKSKQPPDLSWIDDSLTKSLNRIGISGLWLHLNPCTGKKVFAKNTWHLLYGIARSIDENNLVYGPGAFQQLIPELYNRALDTAETFLAPIQKDILIDLYCGIGTGLVRWQNRCNRVMGVELDGETVASAQENAVNTKILRGKCSHRIPQLTRWANEQISGNDRLLYVNPPRTGLEPEILDWIVSTYCPRRMAYLSCSAGTLSRDLRHLETSGYEIVQILPFDFFPQTLHVETLVLIRDRL